MSQKTKKAFAVPHTYTIIFALMVLVAALTWVVPSGVFDTAEVNGREVTVAGTYHEVDKVSVDPETGDEVDLRQGVNAVLEAPTLGIQEAIEVVAFVFVVGGSFQIITATGAIDAGMRRVVRRFKSKDIVVIPVAMLLFALGGSTFGMAEETLPFFAIFLPIMITMGFDSITAFMIVFLGAKAGYVASTINPFSVLISQGILGITGNPQLWLRAIMFVVIVGLTIAFVMLYATRIRKNPEKSLTYHEDQVLRQDIKTVDEETPFTGQQKAVLAVFIGGIALIVWGLVSQGWYMNELSAIFLAMGIISGIIAGFGQKRIAEEFVAGLKDFAFSAIVIGLARGVLVIANNGMIIDTILNDMANGLAGVPQRHLHLHPLPAGKPAHHPGAQLIQPGRPHHAHLWAPHRAHGPEPRRRRHRPLPGRAYDDYHGPHLRHPGGRPGRLQDQPGEVVEGLLEVLFGHVPCLHGLHRHLGHAPRGGLARYPYSLAGRAFLSAHAEKPMASLPAASPFSHQSLRHRRKVLPCPLSQSM